MSERPAPVQRPNGKWWKGRKPIRVEEFMDYDGGEALVVLGTHDIEKAADLVGEKRIADDLGLSVEDGEQHWWRLVPWDATGAGFDSTWIVDPVGGTPCVVWTP
jgi:hypothetical protein